MDLVLALAGSEVSSQAALQEEAESEARRILSENWPGVEALAKSIVDIPQPRGAQNSHGS